MKLVSNLNSAEKALTRRGARKLNPGTEQHFLWHCTVCTVILTLLTASWWTACSSAEKSWLFPHAVPASRDKPCVRIRLEALSDYTHLNRTHRMCDRLDCAGIQKHWLSLCLEEEIQAMIWNHRNDLGLLFLCVSSDVGPGFLLFQASRGVEFKDSADRWEQI